MSAIQEKVKVIRVAAVQMTCQDGKVLDNLARASDFVCEAVKQGAQLVLFPEFMPPGYRLTPELWEAGEPFDGPTTHWLREMACQHGLYLGTSFLEARNGDFVNTFALAEPDGEIAGVVRKRAPSIWEAYFFKGYRGAQFIETELGRIGVGICFDNHTYEVTDSIRAAQVDLMLMPHSYCTPTRPTKLVSQADIDRLNGLPMQVARQYNSLFGVPVVMANKSGPWDSPVPKTILGQPVGYRFSGRSLILDADGSSRAQMCDEEGLITQTVSLDPASKRQAEPPQYSRYIYPGPAGREIFKWIEAVGYWNYRLSRLRKEAAGRCVQKRDFQRVLSA